MSTEKARVEKDKGNAAFKAGDYATAVGHYSAAIIHDRNDFTLPLNRAAAYLKLGKNEDASRDCTTVLSLNPSNVKALFRRGQARLDMDKIAEAREDFEAAEKIEPNNQSVKDELEKIRQKLAKSTVVQGKPAPRKPLEIAPGVRRRVPITIIESESAIPSSTPTTPSESAPPESAPALDSALPSQEATPSEPTLATPKTFQDAKKARDEAKPPPRVGGGIFRASGKNTIFARGDPAAQQTPVPTPSPTPSSQPIIAKSFATLFDFNKAWSSTASTVDRFQLISPNAVAQIKRSMEGFLQVPRITTLALFLSREEKERVVQLLEKVDDQALTDRWKAILKL
ncbi:hypothetical protein AAF712_008725 [Marasmius tenuissimus]|uniref:RNA-polymerase II-associated protein 3-like C-terminal domain-containing protein n=1 Tax=Marasmius tenuissimus TaxID=585030 RepID=A0ABR2ZRG5_9AGAR